MDPPPSHPDEHYRSSRVKESYDPGDDIDVELTIKFGPEKVTEKWALLKDATLDDVFLHASLKWPDYDWAKSKAIVEKRVPAFKSLLKSPDDNAVDMAPLNGNAVKLMAPKISTQEGLLNAQAAAMSISAARNAALGRASHLTRRAAPRSQECNAYTFQTIRPLAYLPNPERSRQFLERLKADPGIKTAMRKHKFSVGLLTEMDPGQYTEANHEGTTRILGLNRNAGEVIELRLRTDAYDGYRDYKTIRKTLCHELAHNVHGPHDKNFWDLCHQIEKEVHDADWLKGGRSVGDEEYRPPVEDESHVDSGGWVGGEYVLGGDSRTTAGLSRREIMARAAESRLGRLEGDRRDNGDEGRNSSPGGGRP